MEERNYKKWAENAEKKGHWLEAVWYYLYAGMREDALRCQAKAPKCPKKV